MEMFTNVVLFLVAALIVAYTILTEATDWIGRADVIENRWPKLWGFMNNRPMRLVLLAVAIGMIAHVGDAASEETFPNPRFVAPTVPSVVEQTEPPESDSSLRRRTIKLADEMYDYQQQRAEKHPPYAYPDSRNPNPSEDQQKKIQMCQVYDQATQDYYLRHFRERLLGIIREYNAKGVPTGFLEPTAEQRPLVFTLRGTRFDNGPNDELAQFRNLAYRVYAQDNLIVLTP